MSQFLTVCMVAREPFQLPLPISLPSVQWPHIFRQNRLSCGCCAPALTTPIITPLLQTIHSYVSPLAWLGDGTGIVWSSCLASCL